jgi:hypothetical protein
MYEWTRSPPSAFMNSITKSRYCGAMPCSFMYSTGRSARFCGGGAEYFSRDRPQGHTDETWTSEPASGATVKSTCSASFSATVYSGKNTDGSK